MKTILFAWVGMHDIKASVEGHEEDLGPIARAIDEFNFDRVVLLDNYGKAQPVPEYIDWLKQRSDRPILHIPAHLKSPIDFGEIYRVAKREVEKVVKEGGGQARPVFHLSPGTPAMAAVWIMLGTGPFAEAELIQSSREQGVQRIEMPFNIFTEFIPDIVEGSDRRLMSFSEKPAGYSKHGIVGQCKQVKLLMAQAELVARRDVPSLIEGETGTGKELLARFLHDHSRRSDNSFVAVNCGAIPSDLFEAEFFGYVKGAFSGSTRDHAGYFEQADGGTLFLDELGELPLDAQVKILRVLNDGVVRRIGDTKTRRADVRIIAATNRSLLEEVAEERFRSDLFYRLAVATFKLPPLREREGDIHLLLEHMLTEVNQRLEREPGYKQKKYSIKAKNLLKRHSWPGNAREMHNTILRICVWCQDEVIQEEDVQHALLPSTQKGKDDILSRPLGEGFNIQELQDFLTSAYVKRALAESHGNKSRAAELLGLNNYQTLTNWIKKYDIKI